jgi:hypothetical protein
MLRFCPHSKNAYRHPARAAAFSRKASKGSLNALIAMLQTATLGSKGSCFAGDVQNSTAHNFAFVFGEKGLGSVGETQTIERVE